MWLPAERAGPASGSFDCWRRPATRSSISTSPIDRSWSSPASSAGSTSTNAGKVYDALFQFRPEGICHLAANPAPSGQAQIDVFDNNVLSAHNLMQAAGDLGVKRFIYASSEMATGLLTEGKVPAQIPFDESERHPSPNAYALSKSSGGDR